MRTLDWLVIASYAAAVRIAYAESLGLSPISIMWIVPGSFFIGVVSGSLASLLPIGRASKKNRR